MRKQNKNLSSTKTAVYVIIFFMLGHLLLSALGLVPSEVSEFNQRVLQGVQNIHRLSYQRPPKPILPNADISEEDRETIIGTAPMRIVIDKIDVDVDIKSPEEANIEKLDAALQEGVVHYPGSGGIGGERRMFLFGHSSRLPVVQNQAYQSFNGLDELTKGDEIRIIGDDGKEQIYVVTATEVVDQDERLVSFESGSGKLTLSTCTTFGARENRVVVDAELKT